MRRLLLVTALGLAACTEPEPGTLIPSQPFWVEFPAEVRTNEPFELRLVVWGPGCYERQELRVHLMVWTSYVTVQSEFLVQGQNNNVLCLRDPAPYDTTVTVPGLAAIVNGAYEIEIVPPEQTPLVPSGSVAVRGASEPIDRDKQRAAGTATGATDIEGCAVMQRPFDAPIPVENPPSATWTGFVLGYSFTPATPLCGQTRAFHVDEVR
jgi:hypothetical protein